MSKLYNTMLTLAFVNQTVTHDSLKALNASESFSEQMIKKAVEEKHLRVKTVKIKKRAASFTEKIYTTTPAGIRYLIDNCDISWINNLDPENTKNLAAFDVSARSTKRANRMAQISEAKIMSELAGAESFFLIHMLNDDSQDETELEDDAVAINENYSLFNTEEDKKEMNTYAQLIMNCPEINEYVLRQFIIDYNRSSGLPNDYLRFVDCIRLKQLFVSEMTGSDLAFFKRCSFQGILDSYYKTVLIYSIHTIGLPWSKWKFQSESTILTWWKASHSLTEKKRSYYSGLSGVLFVKNARQFHNAYFDVVHVRKEKLGEGLNHFYVVPKTCEGASHLRFLMLTDDKEYNETIKTELLETGMYSLNENDPYDAFPLCNLATGNPAVILPQMDIIQMQTLQLKCEISNVKSFDIICFEWQKDYYNRIFPHAAAISLQ